MIVSDEGRIHTIHCSNKQSTGTKYAVDLTESSLVIREMLEHTHTHHGIEGFIGKWQRFGMTDHKIRICGVPSLCDFNVNRKRIETGDPPARTPRDHLSPKAVSTANIQNLASVGRLESMKHPSQFHSPGRIKNLSNSHQRLKTLEAVH